MSDHQEVLRSDATTLTLTRHEGKPYASLALVRVEPEVGRVLAGAITLWDEENDIDTLITALQSMKKELANV